MSSVLRRDRRNGINHGMSRAGEEVEWFLGSARLTAATIAMGANKRKSVVSRALRSHLPLNFSRLSTADMNSLVTIIQPLSNMSASYSKGMDL